MPVSTAVQEGRVPFHTRAPLSSVLVGFLRCWARFYFEERCASEMNNWIFARFFFLLVYRNVLPFPFTLPTKNVNTARLIDFSPLCRAGQLVLSATHSSFPRPLVWRPRRLALAVHLGSRAGATAPGLTNREIVTKAEG